MKIECKIEQGLRVLRVYALSKLYADYRDIYLNECLLKHDNDYSNAEKLSDMINSVFMGETKPTDFIKDYDKITNELIDKSREFKIELDRINQSTCGLNKKGVLAFCKQVEHGSFHLLKINNQFHYQSRYLLSYCQSAIDKETFLEGMKEVSLFTKKKKTNNQFFKRTFLAIEKTHYEIMSKQYLRNYDKENTTTKRKVPRRTKTDF